MINCIIVLYDICLGCLECKFIIFYTFFFFFDTFTMENKLNGRLKLLYNEENASSKYFKLSQIYTQLRGFASTVSFSSRDLKF